MTKVLKAILFSVVLFTLVGCGKDPIVGRWERYGDSHAGLEIQVEEFGDDQYRAKITYLTPGLAEVGFNNADVKWKNLTKISNGVYSGEDLWKGGVEGANYKEFELIITEDGNLKYTLGSDASYNQRWKPATYDIVRYEGSINFGGELADLDFTYKNNENNGFFILSADGDIEFMEISDINISSSEFTWNMDDDSYLLDISDDIITGTIDGGTVQMTLVD